MPVDLSLIRFSGFVAALAAVCLCLGGPVVYAQTGPLGQFQESGDVGGPALPGSATWDAAKEEYRLSAAGVNMWGSRDELHFVWTRLTGDFTLRAQVGFVGEGVDPHRKAGVIVRTSLDADAPYADAVLHGDGLTSLQYRRTPGAETEEVVSEVTGADVLQIERKGTTITVSAARLGEPLQTSQVTDLDLGEEVYVGLFLCSHNPEVVEQAVFRNVRLVPPTPERRYNPTETRALLEKLLLENILPFWYPGVLDEEQGGYRLNHDAEGHWLGPADKALVTQARTVWFFSRLHGSKYGKPEHLEAARHGFRFLKTKMWDHEHGGFYWAVSSDGSEAVEPQKHLYGQSFGLYALAEYIRASKDSEAIELAKELFALLEEKAHDKEHGGYLELFPRNWSRDPADLPRVGAMMGRDRVLGRKLMNTHLHLMEAFTTYFEVTGDELVRERLAELIFVESNAVVRKDLGACTDRYERDWTPLMGERDKRVSYGHDIENVWLLIEACNATGISNGPLLDLYETLFAYSLQYGWDAEHGGFFYTGPFRQPADVRSKSWWVQAEGLTSGIFMYRLTGDEKYYGVFEKTLQWIVEEQADWARGDWHAMIGTGTQQNKSGPWKSPYHNGRAVLECLEILDATPK